MSSLSEKESEDIAEIRRRLHKDLTPYFDTDFNILRWLQGFDFDLDTVEKKLRHHLQFRRAWGFDQILQSDCRHPVVRDYWPWGLFDHTGMDNNAIVFIQPIAKLDWDGILHAASLVDIMRSSVYDAEMILEKIKKQERESGKQSGLLFIMDLEGLRMDHGLITIVMKEYRTFTEFFAEHYVELFQKFLLVNVPPFMYYLWRIVSPILPEKTRNKIEIFGKDWRNNVIQHALPERVPIHWGGTLTDENNDPMCRSRIRLPPTPKVPATLFDSCEVPGPLTSLVVAPGKSQVVTCEITNISAQLQFCLTSETDFGFGVWFSMAPERDVEKMEMVFPEFKKFPGPLLVPIREILAPVKVGFYHFQFDNSFSWFYSAKLKYSIDILNE